jgi:HEPN domain-containing protein
LLVRLWRGVKPAQHVMRASPELRAEPHARWRRVRRAAWAPTSNMCLNASRSLLATAAFHAQQAAEKAINAWLTWHGKSFRKTHNLLEVATPAWEIDATLHRPLQEALVLTQYAWKHRYPGDWTPPRKAEVQDALRLAQAVYRAIEDRLPECVK